MNRAVFFDRDGVLNEAIVRDGKPYPPASVEELRIVSRARYAVRRVRDAGYLAIAITNQPDVARGTVTRKRVEEINSTVASRLSLDSVYCCFHDDDDRCECRKPKPGLLLQAAGEHDIDLSQSYVVGDRLKDVQSGRSAGCTTVFIDFGYRETPAQTGADVVVASLDAAVDAILNRQGAVR